MALSRFPDKYLPSGFPDKAAAESTAQIFKNWERVIASQTGIEKY